jgi:hypothetical protein
MAGIARKIGLALGIVVAALSVPAFAAGPADGLFRLVPPDAAATLAVEDLRSRTREFFDSPVAQGFRRLPAFQAWIASGRFARFQAAARKLERALGENVATIRDELLGDAVVLALRVPANGRAEEASGLLLARASNRPLLDRLIRGINDAERRTGELTSLTVLTHSGVSYWERAFRPASGKPTEYYSVLSNDIFAWSNSRDLIEGVIRRSSGSEPSLADTAKFQQLRNRLPAQALASLFVAPRFLTQVVAASARREKPVGDRAGELIGRYLGAMEYLGVSLRWRDGIVLETEEILDPGKLDPWVRQWAARQGEISPALRRAPEGALAMASVHVDWSAILDAVRSLVPEPHEPRVDNMLVALDGILLGRDFGSEIVPHLGPGALAYLEAADGERNDNGPPGATLSKVLLIGHDNAPGLTAAVENALRTYLAVYALGPQDARKQLRFEQRDVGGRYVTALAPATPLAFATEGDRIIVASSAAAVARAIMQAANPTEGPLEQLRAARFPRAGSFACINVLRLHDYIVETRAAIAARLAAGNKHSLEDARRDLDEAIALLALFRQAYATSDMEADASAVHRSVGLVPREAGASP